MYVRIRFNKRIVGGKGNSKIFLEDRKDLKCFKSQRWIWARETISKLIPSHTESVEMWGF